MFLLNALAAAGEESAPMLMHPYAFAGIAAAVFLVLGFVTYSYRDVANRHSDKTDSAGAGHDHH